MTADALLTTPCPAWCRQHEAHRAPNGWGEVTHTATVFELGHATAPVAPRLSVWLERYDSDPEDSDGPIPVEAYNIGDELVEVKIAGGLSAADARRLAAALLEAADLLES